MLLPTPACLLLSFLLFPPFAGFFYITSIIPYLSASYNIVYLPLCNPSHRNTHLWLTLHPDLASHCRLLLHDRPKHTKLYRWLALYPLYALSEIAIICTDLAELLGSAIALCMLFPKLPLWAGVLLTVLDVFFLLALGDPLRGRPVKMFEYLIVALVSCVVHISQ